MTSRRRSSGAASTTTPPHAERSTTTYRRYSIKGRTAYVIYPYYRPSYFFFMPSVGGASNQSFRESQRVCASKFGDLCIGDAVFEPFTTCGGRCRFPTSSNPSRPAITARCSVADTFGPLSTTHFSIFRRPGRGFFGSFRVRYETDRKPGHERMSNGV